MFQLMVEAKRQKFIRIYQTCFSSYQFEMNKFSSHVSVYEYNACIRRCVFVWVWTKKIHSIVLIINLILIQFHFIKWQLFCICLARAQCLWSRNTTAVCVPRCVCLNWSNRFFLLFFFYINNNNIMEWYNFLFPFETAKKQYKKKIRTRVTAIDICTVHTHTTYTHIIIDEETKNVDELRFLLGQHTKTDWSKMDGIILSHQICFGCDLYQSAIYVCIQTGRMCK